MSSADDGPHARERAADGCACLRCCWSDVPANGPPFAVRAGTCAWALACRTEAPMRLRGSEARAHPMEPVFFEVPLTHRVITGNPFESLVAWRQTETTPRTRPTRC